MFERICISYMRSTHLHHCRNSMNNKKKWIAFCFILLMRFHIDENKQWEFDLEQCERFVVICIVNLRTFSMYTLVEEFSRKLCRNASPVQRVPHRIFINTKQGKHHTPFNQWDHTPTQHIKLIQGHDFDTVFKNWWTETTGI